MMPFTNEIVYFKNEKYFFVETGFCSGCCFSKMYSYQEICVCPKEGFSCNAPRHGRIYAGIYKHI